MVSKVSSFFKIYIGPLEDSTLGVMVKPCTAPCVGYLLQISDRWIWPAVSHTYTRCYQYQRNCWSRPTPQRMNNLWIICISIWKDASSHVVAVQNKFKQLTTKASSTNTKVELFCWRKWWFTDSFHVWCLLVWSTLMRVIIDLAEKHKLGKFEKNA